MYFTLVTHIIIIDRDRVVLILFEITTQIVIIELGQNYSHSILLHSSRTDKVQNGNNPHFVLGPYGSHVTPIYIACFPLIIRMGQDNVSFSVPSQANNRMFNKNRHSVVNLLPNSEIYEFSREQGEAYMACVISNCYTYYMSTVNL